MTTARNDESRGALIYARCCYGQITSVDRRQIDYGAFVVRVVVGDDLSEFDVAQMQYGCQNAVYGAHLVVLEADLFESVFQLSEFVHVGLQTERRHAAECNGKEHEIYLLFIQRPLVSFCCLDGRTEGNCVPVVVRGPDGTL